VFGSRLAHELLLTDKRLNAEEALKVGFINGIIDKFDKGSEWFDPNIIPVIPKLLSSDYKTLVTSMEQFNLSKDVPKLEAISQREADALVNHWSDPDFI
jgi:enoyl-CoA hydratase/carnithine racemase